MVSSGLWPYAPQCRLYFAGLRIEHDHAMVAVAIGDVKFIGPCRQTSWRGLEIFDVVAAFALAGLADLHQEFSVLRELQDHVVVEWPAAGLRLIQGGGLRWRRDCGPAAIAADPDVAFVVDGDSVIGGRPIVALARSAPVPDEIALFVELENRRRRHAALRGGRIRGGVIFHSFERSAAVNDPDVILGVDRNADGHAQQPMIRQRLRPHGIDFKTRRLYARGFHGGALFEHRGTDAERDEERGKSEPDIEIAFHISPPVSVSKPCCTV